MIRSVLNRFLRRLAVVALLAPVVVGAASCRRAAGPGGALPVEIKDVRIGFPPGPLVGDEEASRRSEPLFKSAHWTPVLVTIAGRGKLEAGDLVVQTLDSDDLLNEYTVRLPVLDFTAEQPTFQIVTYVRPGKPDSPVTVSVRSAGQSVAFPEKQASGLEPASYLYATLGSRLPGLRLPGLDEKNQRRSEIGALDQAAELPTRWIGYQTVDLAVLTTSNDEFTTHLLNDNDRRNITALIEWVRRGGRLLIAVSKNQSLLQNREDLKDFLPVDLAGTAALPSARVEWGTTVLEELGDPLKKTPLSLARVKPKANRGVRTLAVARTESGDVHPLVVSSSYGLGRITVLTADPDQPPFTRWKKQGEFWERALKEIGPQYAQARNEPTFAGYGDESASDLSWQLRKSLEQFENVPVISFSWVALFILIYILIVGPLDYLFLKKVVKRLELTWVTFPIVVLVVSAAAYLTARALKGDSQMIQKIDLIDFDLQSQTAQGRTWFCIFSPRVQNYTVGVEPADGWGVTRDQVTPPVVSWLGQPDKSRQSLIRRSYDYDTTAGGLQRVPIQVWSDKCFQASWHHKLDPAAPPLTVDLRAVGDELTGSIVSHLPVEINRAVVLYRNKAYELGTIVPGATNRKQVTAASKLSFEQWAQANRGVSAPQPVNTMQTRWGPPPRPTLEPSENIVREIMFHEAFETGRARTARNAGFRELDQSWRLSADDPGASAVVYGTVALLPGNAEDVVKAPSTITRLWLGALPGDRDGRPKMTGTLRQETHLRFFVPVKKNP